MQFSDEGHIVDLLRYGENSLIVTLLSRLHGKVTGYVRGGCTKKQLGVYQLGNTVSFNAYARLEENMPQFRGVELTKAGSVCFMADFQKLAVLSAFCELMKVCVPEKVDLERLGTRIDRFISGIDTPNWLALYSFVEYELLSFLGIGLDLSVCAATGTTKDLAFVSPKSGKAVCRSAGIPYADKMFGFPLYVIDNNESPSLAEIINVLKMTAWFLNKNFFEIHSLNFPHNRANLLHILNLEKE
jgi:DNA repair protein RecO (recombination protein O)